MAINRSSQGRRYETFLKVTLYLGVLVAIAFIILSFVYFSGWIH